MGSARSSLTQTPKGTSRRYDYFPATGYLKSETVDQGGSGLQTQYNYDAVGNVIQMIDPKGQATDYTVNALNQVVRTLSRVAFGTTRYRTDYFYDANDNFFRTERQNLKEDGSAYAHNPIVDTDEFDILDQLRARNKDKSLNDNSVTGSVRTEYFYDANQNRTAQKSPLAVSGSVPNNIETTLYDERDNPMQGRDRGTTTRIPQIRRLRTLKLKLRITIPMATLSSSSMPSTTQRTPLRPARSFPDRPRAT